MTAPSLPVQHATISLPPTLTTDQYQVLAVISPELEW
jgi:hypothetical protein